MILSTAMQTALNQPAINPVWFVWVKAKNRTTGAIEASGIWTGISDYTTSIDGETRTYRGAGGLIAIGEIGYSAGVEIQPQSFSVSLMDAAVVEMVRVYDTKLAEVDVHLGLNQPDTNAFIGMTRAFKGNISNLSISDDFNCEIECESSLRAGTKPLYLKQSDAAQRKRLATDTGMQYSSISRDVKLFWGQASATNHQVTRNVTKVVQII